MSDAAAITHHAAERGRERLGLKTASVERMAELALEKGIERAETSGRLRRFLDAKAAGFPGAHSRIYGEVCFFYRGRVLITCYQLPRELRGVVAKIRRAKRQA
jgi:hypothetical protein